MEDRKKILLVVIDEHTLGYMQPNADTAGILHTSILRGSPLGYWSGTVYVKNSKVRLASEQDFNDYRCSFAGYDNDKTIEYVYQK